VNKERQLGVVKNENTTRETLLPSSLSTPMHDSARNATTERRLDFLRGLSSGKLGLGGEELGVNVREDTTCAIVQAST
jgi:hypothetical protein